VPFLLTGIIWWPGRTSTQPPSEGTGLANGTYEATYLGSQSAANGDPAVVNLEVDGKSIIVTEGDLSGSALAHPSALFEGQRGQTVQITVKNGYITDYTM
jgi:hypothetical protein